ncbi:major facilitator superfamily permease [Ferroplasma acidiphilum]|uniref:Major facilitator superfamily permease n=1 Tax=Ferroplasma acidiphilum TaxID=74969 RepID=A0A1V0N484_9ARCH|nr:MFS transporter [Ferroplasma acidiphilum]ARD84921.1 major facilitator superfamily permease [Ferroplasma acidiphilum]
MNNTNNKLLLINLIMLLSVAFTMRTSTNMLMTVVPVFTKYVINADVFFVGLTATLYGIGAMVANVLINGRINIEKTPRTIALLLLIMTVGIFFYLLSNNIYEVLILSTVTGLSMGVVQPLLMTVTNVIAPPGKRDKYIAAYTASLSLSLIFGVVMEGLITSSINVRYAFLIFLFISLLSTVLMFTLSTRIKMNMKRKNRLTFKEILGKASHSLKQGKVLFALFGNIAYAFPFILLITYGSLMGKEYNGINPDIFFYLLALFYIVSFLTRLVLSVKNVKNHEILMYASFAATIIGYLLLGIDAGIIMFIGSLLILGFPHGSIYPTASYYIASSVELEDLNVVYSVFILIMDVIIFLIPFVFGIISTIYSIRIAIYLTAVPMGLLLLTSVFFNIKDNRAIKNTPVTQ